MGINASRLAVTANRVKENVNIVDEMIECNRQNPVKVCGCIRFGGENWFQPDNWKNSAVF
jgi:hypothetical protein